MIALNANQLIILLQVYRGLLNERLIITEDTYVQDMRFLLEHDLVKYDGTHYVTPRGADRVFAALDPS